MSIILTISGLIVFLLIAYYILCIPHNLYPPFEAFKEYVPKHLIAESYEVETLDGYILTLLRVYNPVEVSTTKLPLLIQHGLGGSAFNFCISGPSFSPAYMLADIGFDVWLGNNRGNFFSNKHRTLKYSDQKFFDYSF